MGATHTLLVEGDCLLLELLVANPRVDWARGGQFLQLRALLEEFLASLNQANTTQLRYWVVWLTAVRCCCPTRRRSC